MEDLLYRCDDCGGGKAEDHRPLGNETGTEQKTALGLTLVTLGKASKCPCHPLLLVKSSYDLV